MLRRLRSRLTYANVISTLALFLVVSGGTAYAVNTIGSDDVIDESLLSEDIKNQQVTTSDLAVNSVWGSRIRDNAILSAHVVDNVLTGGDVMDNSLTGDDINESTLNPSAASRIDFDKPQTHGGTITLFSKGGLTLNARCHVNRGDADKAALSVTGSSAVPGTFIWTQTEDTNGATVGTGNFATPLASERELFYLLTSPGDYRRIIMSAVYRTPTSTVTLQLVMTANDINGRCVVQGSALPMS